MNCPVDATPLVMTERQDVEIDYCPQCRGVWLDRGELDKIIERAATMSPQAGPAVVPGYPVPPAGYPARGGYDDHHGGYGGGHHGGRKRRGWLGELFD